MPALAFAFLAFLAFLLVPETAHAARSWLRPVDGTLLREFALGADPYARGAHRGADFAAHEGAAVRSACSGRVTFTGRLPRGGSTVSVRCAELVATYQQLGTIAVRAGGRVGAGALLGTVGASHDPRTLRAHLHLGAREVATGRYLDPLALLRRAPPAAPLIPGRAPRRVPLGPPPRAAPRPAPLVAPDGRAPAPAPGVPWPVWIGLASMALALPLGGLGTVRRRRRRRTATARAAAAAR